MIPLDEHDLKQLDEMGLTNEQFQYMADVLANWENSTDEEIVECLKAEGVAQEHCDRVIELRTKAFMTPVPMLTVANHTLDIESAI